MDTIKPDHGHPPIFEGEHINLQAKAVELPDISLMAKRFFEVAGDSFTSYDAVVEVGCQFFAEATGDHDSVATIVSTMFQYEDSSIAGKVFVKEDPSTRSAEDPKVADVPHVRAEAIFELTCSAAIGPYTTLPVAEAAAVLRAALDVATYVCSDALLAFMYLDSYVGQEIDNDSGVLKYAQWGDLSEIEQGLLANRTRINNVLEAAGLAKQ